MPGRGDVANLKDPVAQELLQAPIPAKLAFTAADGSPRVFPIWFHWDGSEVVMASAPSAAKVRGIRQNPRVALTIDTQDAPYKVLNIRGTARIEDSDRPIEEYRQAAVRYLGAEGAKQYARRRGEGPQTRIAVRPEWVELIDFSRR